MSKYNSDLDKTTMDLVSGSMYSLNFLRNISQAIFDSRREEYTVREFHELWLKKTKNTEFSVPYCLGAIFGHLYCGILLSKERWMELLPECSIKSAPVEWGFANSIVKSPKITEPSIKYSIRRIRNALGHGNISINVPNDLDFLKDELDFEKRTTINFYDEDPRDKTDIFEIEVSIEGLLKMTKSFHAITYPEITKVKLG